MALKSVITKIEKVTQHEKEAMFSLHSKNFCNVIWDKFISDLEEKGWVIILRDAAGLLAGFSTLQIIRLNVSGLERLFLFSGDTIIDKTYWHESNLAGSFGHFMIRLIDQNPFMPIYWFLISKGYRTYRFLPVFFERFYPACNASTPPEYSTLLNAIAEYKFRNTYLPDSGIIRSCGNTDRLSPELCTVPVSRQSDPHVRFFLKANPKYYSGDELACIANISRNNFSRYAWHVIKNTRVEWNE